MPKRDDIKSVLVIGSGPIVIGQACEFDYSGTQACRVLREEGVRVILVNSNPATIMTDPEFADATYVEPITPEVIEKIIAKERPDAILPTLGGQTALNCAIALHEHGILEKYDVELIGANVEAIARARTARSSRRSSLDARLRPSRAQRHLPHDGRRASRRRTTSATRSSCARRSRWAALGSGFAYDEADLRRIAARACRRRPTTEVLLEESILGWKEYELELMRDKADNVVVVCSIENVDPIGVHTGDSITVAPALTLTDREYQNLRDIGIDIIREVGVDTGGCNIQFAIDPDDGRIIVIEMNPRVSRSLGARVQGDRLPDRQDRREARRRLHASTRSRTTSRGRPRRASSRRSTTSSSRCRGSRSRSSPRADETLTTTMKSVGEAMAIGRNFTEALQKALRSLEKQGRAASPGSARARRRRRGAARGRRRCRTTAGCARCSRRCAAGATDRAGVRGHQHRPVVPRPDRAAQRGRATRCARRPS